MRNEQTDLDGRPPSGAGGWSAHGDPRAAGCLRGETTRPAPRARVAHGRRRLSLAVGLAMCLGHLTLLGPAAAARAVSIPSVYTGAAASVSYGTATLIGQVAPHGSNTSYYFQYGPTRAYGAQTPLADAGAGTAVVKVAVPVSGLQPITVYYYRLIAVNAAGAATGADRAFKTAKVPLSLAITAGPNPTIFGGTLVVQGTLSGTGNGNVPVALQANPFPYTQGFATIGNPELTSATGGFSFPFVGLTAATQFRVVTTTTKPAVVSLVAREEVAVKVEAHVGRTRRRHHARIYGTVTPAIDGMEVGIMRVLGGHEVLVAGTVLLHHNATSSRFSRVIRVKRRGLYRVFVKVTNGAQTSNYSQPLFIR
jgi:hypothetical protein